jgi:hypothetical protein
MNAAIWRWTTLDSGSGTSLCGGGSSFETLLLTSLTTLVYGRRSIDQVMPYRQILLGGQIAYT